MVRVLPSLLATRGKQRLSILIYHRILPAYDFMRPSEPTAREFDLQMGIIARYFNPLPLHNALKMLESGGLPERAVAITFDDGYADNEEVALPIMRRWNVPATVFVATGFLNGGQMWNDKVIESVRNTTGPELDLKTIGLGIFTLQGQEHRRQAAQDILRTIKHWLPEKRDAAVNYIAAKSCVRSQDLMLTDSQLRNMHTSGVEIGAHTVNHPILASLSREKALAEIEQSKTALEAKLGSAIRFFAYPNGVPGRDYLPDHRDAVKELGFDAALSTHWGVASSQSDRWQLPRFTPWDRTPLRFTTRLLLNYRNPA